MDPVSDAFDQVNQWYQEAIANSAGLPPGEREEDMAMEMAFEAGLYLLETYVQEGHVPTGSRPLQRPMQQMMTMMTMMTNDGG
jgi:hypothetical protein